RAPRRLRARWARASAARRARRVSAGCRRWWSLAFVVSSSRLLWPFMSRLRTGLFAVALLAACATPPERTERDQALRAAIAPCLQRYPSVKLTGIDDYGQVYARAPEHDDINGFEQCAKTEIQSAGLFRP